MSPMMPIMKAVTSSALGLPKSWDTTSLPMSCESATRVTIKAAAVDSSSEGICATRPSPMVSST